MTNTDPLADLEDALTEGVPAPFGEPVVPETFEDAAVWLAKIKQIQEHRAEYKAAHEAVLERLTKRYQERMDSLATQEEWYTEALQTYHRALVAQDPERLTVHLPTGELVARKNPARWEFDNPEAFIEWAQINARTLVHFPDPVVKVSEVKKAYKNATVSDGRVMFGDGTILPGVKVSEGERQFKVKPE